MRDFVFFDLKKSKNGKKNGEKNLKFDKKKVKLAEKRSNSTKLDNKNLKFNKKNENN